MKNNTIDPKIQLFHDHAELRKEYQDICETRIGDGKDQYIKHLETLVLAYRKKFGGIDIIPKG
jgi:hypothetical protein